MAIGIMGYAEVGYKTELKVNSRGNNGEKSGEIKNICSEIHSCHKYYIMCDKYKKEKIGVGLFYLL
jgi:hypothetical protein